MTEGSTDGRTLRILYIAGSQNCGSTMLDAILGNAPGAFSLGEVGGFHRYLSAEACVCGEPPASCGPCRAVVSLLALEGDVEAFHQISPLPLKERRPHWALISTSHRTEYARVADEVFDAVAAETGASVLIDSSKNVARAAALVHESRHDVRVVHLVRDGRGYYRSRQRRAAPGGRRPFLPITILPWSAKNLFLSEVLRRRVPDDRYLLCRYEDLMRDPDGELRRIGVFAGLDTNGLAATAIADGVVRRHLFEPRRRVDYRLVRLDPTRSRSPTSPRHDLYYWLSGGFLSSRWGYARKQP